MLPVSGSIFVRNICLHNRGIVIRLSHLILKSQWHWLVGFRIQVGWYICISEGYELWFDTMPHDVHLTVQNILYFFWWGSQTSYTLQTLEETFWQQQLWEQLASCCWQRFIKAGLTSSALPSTSVPQCTAPTASPHYNETLVDCDLLPVNKLLVLSGRLRFTASIDHTGWRTGRFLKFSEG